MKKLILIAAIMILATVAMVSAACPVSISAQSTTELLQSITSLNTDLANCPIAIGSPANKIFSTDIIELTINMQGGTQEMVLITMVGGSITGISRGAGTSSYDVTIDECALDTILSAQPRSGAFAYLYKEKKVGIKGNSFGKRMKLLTMKPIISIGFKKIQTPVDIVCSDKIYGDQPYNQGEVLKKAGETCQHGGQCETGNCVGAGQGPPWDYRCSCDPFKYTTTGCKPYNP